MVQGEKLEKNERESTTNVAKKEKDIWKKELPSFLLHVAVKNRTIAFFICLALSMEENEKDWLSKGDRWTRGKDSFSRFWHVYKVSQTDRPFI